MNIELANRLLQYRKNSGLSQEELAEKLNISRQSVSKWERAEASPDTDNLIELAKIYNVTLDELLNVNKEVVTPENKTKKRKIIIDDDVDLFENDKDEIVTINSDGIHVESKDGKVNISFDGIYIKNGNDNIKIGDCDDLVISKDKKKKHKKANEIIQSILVLFIVALYVLLCSFNIATWSKFWVIFVYYPAISSLVNAIIKKNPSSFAYPVFIAGIYVTIGMYLEQWHPWWALFVTIPLYYVVVKPFSKKRIIYYKDKDGEERSVEINADTISIQKDEEK